VDAGTIAAPTFNLQVHH